MRGPIKLEFVAFDSQEAGAGTGPLHFFHAEQSGVVASAAQIPEPALVKWLTQKQAVRELILMTLSLTSSARCQVQVRSPFLEAPNTPPGDIDFLASDPERPDKAVAIEWKRVKVRVMGEGQEVINKIDAIGDAAPQVRGLKNLGFDRTYLAVVAAIDGREFKSNNFLGRGASDNTFRRIIDFASGVGVPQSVGLLYVEIAQPLNKSIGYVAMVSAAIIRPAEHCGQTDRITNRVKNYIDANSVAHAGGVP